MSPQSANVGAADAPLAAVTYIFESLAVSADIVFTPQPLRSVRPIPGPIVTPRPGARDDERGRVWKHHRDEYSDEETRRSRRLSRSRRRWKRYVSDSGSSSESSADFQSS